MYAYLERIDKLQRPSVISFFVAGIRPAWEDEQNAKGGIFSLQVRDTMNSSKIWENLLLSLIGHQFSTTIGQQDVDYTEEITGIEVKNIHDKLNITVWNRSSQPGQVDDIKTILSQILKLPDKVRFDYKPNSRQKGPFPPNPRRNPSERDHEERGNRDFYQGSFGGGGYNRHDNRGDNRGYQYRGRGRQFDGERGRGRGNMHYQGAPKPPKE
ncbi:MAG: hypothetical protein EZS28_008217 [Streblomastix strix]|uniref:Eukaryotic translation initiation factor 4E n=1 Tax=Streblomastix strix TaxID=222440 RepID=A0A5J4WN91_9EUKA|nr:MAG: hypothetical protein EZS28_008217 [Streblomastix strix]